MAWMSTSMRLVRVVFRDVRSDRWLLERWIPRCARNDNILLDGVPAPEALAARAAELGLAALALTDHDALYGAVRFVLAAREARIKPILGAEMTLEDDTHLTLLVETKEGYANLCRLITLVRHGQPKGVARLARRDLAAHAGGLIALSGCRQGEISRPRPGRFRKTCQV